MAVVHKYADELPDPALAKGRRAPITLQNARVRANRFTVSFTNGDSASSTFIVGKVPSHAVISTLSQIITAGITGVTDVDIGVQDAPDCILDGGTLASAGPKALAGKITAANATQQLWQLAGMASDPRKELEIILTMKTAATATGKAVLEMIYCTD